MRSSLSINKHFCIVFVNCKALIKIMCNCKVFNIHRFFCKWSLEVSTFRSSGRHCRSISVFFCYFVNCPIRIDLQTLTLKAARFLPEGFLYQTYYCFSWIFYLEQTIVSTLLKLDSCLPVSRVVCHSTRSRRQLHF